MKRAFSSIAHRIVAHLVTLTVLALAVTSWIGGSAVAQTIGQVAAYSFDEGTGTTVADASGSGITGTIQGATWTTAGWYGNALSFNGTSSYVNLGNPAALQITGSMTWSAWVMATGNPPDDGQIISKANNVSGWQLKTSPDTGPHTFGIAISASGNSHVQRYSNTVRLLNTWYHVAGVYNAAAQTLDIYVNGVLDNGALSGTVPSSQVSPNVNVNIGRRSGGFYFNGIIDEVRIYSRPLTQAEIQADMNTSIGNPIPDTEPPTEPADLTATAVSGTQIDLSWTASADNVGVTGYLVERCQGAGCTDFAEIATPAGTTYNDTAVTADTDYNYRVRATDAAGNLSLYSNEVSATTPATIPELVAAYSFDEGTGTTVADASGSGITGTIQGATWTTAGWYGNALSFNGTSSYVNLGNPAALQITGSMTWSAWVMATGNPPDDGQIISKANNVSGWQLKTSPDTGPHTFGIAISASGNSHVQRYSNTVRLLNTWYHVAGVYNAAAQTLDIYVNGVLDNGALSGTVPSSQVSPNVNVNIGRRSGGFYFNGIIDEVRIYSRPLTQAEIQADMNTSIGNPIPDTEPPTEPADLTATAVSGTQIDLSWTASADNVGVTGYLVERCQGAGCTDFAEIATPAGTTYNDTAVTADTDYNYRVRATDAAGNLSPYSNEASATTPVPDTEPPTAPANLTATAVSGTQIDLSWTASTDNVGVNAYLVERCQGAGCTSFSSIAILTGTQFNDSGLSENTSYSYRVRATDAAGNLSLYSNEASATTLAPDTDPPTAPANLTAAPVSGTQINLSWTASTDNVGVIGYLVERCQGAGCADFAEIATPAGTTYNDTGLTADTDYNYRVRATDAAGNLSPYSNEVSATTPATIPELVAAYSFDEGTGTTVADASGSGITGTIQGATWTTAGWYGNALSFNGTGSYVDLGNPAALQITGSMTWSAWVMATGNPPDDGQIISKSDNAYGWQLKTSPDTGPHTFGIAISANSNSHVQRYSNTVRLLNTWYHVAGVYNAAAQTLDIYVNGVLDNGVLSGTVPSSQVSPNVNVNIGRRSGGFYFNGIIDEVRIYSRPLTQAEIQADMNTPLGGTSPDTTPPQVVITFPLNNTQVNDIVIVTADAIDNVGIAGVQFLVDDLYVGAEDTNPPYGLSWDTRTVANGTHTLTARARDTSGNFTVSAPITVNVANTNSFQNEILATGFTLPTNIEFLPDGRMLVVELQGVIKVLPPPYTQPDPTPFLQLTNVGSAGVQQGVYDIALDPDFLNNGFYYVFYTAGSPNHDRVSRFTANASLTGTVPDSELILYEDPQNANAEHHGGAVNFGNDGKIYFTTGEHFSAGDAQLLSSPRGKIHRINTDGTVPTDNPFYDGTGPNWDSIWALGLRNPFRAYYDAPTGRLIIGDVGGNDYSVAKEEVNLGAAGANYGWPNFEGSCPASCTSPIYFYPHNGRDAAVTGGFVYHGSQFPSSYQGSYFFADYTQNWIRRLTFDENGNVNGVFNFEPSDGSVDGPYGDIVYLTEGPDGALYYVDLGYSDISGTFGVSKIRRIRYFQSNQAPISVASANPTSGSAPLTVAFSSAGSLDPEGQPITYLWTFGDGVTSNAANPSYTYTQAGQYTVRLSVSDGVNSTLSTPLFISAGNKPTATILSPQDGGLFIAGDTISFSGEATDTEDGLLPASTFTWNIDFLHEGHVHPGTPITGVTSGSFDIPTSGHDFSGSTGYRIRLTVTDSDGLQDIQSVFMYPEKVNLTFDSVPTGLTLKLDGIDHTTPFIYDTLVNFTHTIEAPNQTQGQNTYTFDSWSDGGAGQHEITVPAADQSYIAVYTVTPNPLPSGLAVGWSLNEGTGTTAGDSSGNNNILSLLNGATWSTGQYNSGLFLSGSANASAADSVSLNLSSSYTLTAWINPSSLNGYQTVLIKENTAGGGGCGYWLQTVGDQISSGFNDGSGCIEHTAIANLQTGIWHHIAAVFDDSANTYQIYLNGNLLSSESETTAPVPNNQNLTIGRTAYGENWNGLLDEVRIYDRALSQAEIQADMSTPLP